MAWSLREFKGAAVLNTSSSARAATPRHATPMLARHTQPVSPVKINPGEDLNGIRLWRAIPASQRGLRAPLK
jgi:hypothetical protein